MWMNIKKNSLVLWNLIDPVYFHLTRLNYVRDNLGKQTIMRVRLTRYKGRRIIMGDGTVINKNDVLLKIHLHNVKVLKQIQGYDSDVRRAIIIFKSVQESLPALARYIQGNYNSDKIKGLIGITMLYKGCNKLGFETHLIKNRFYKIFKIAALLPIHLLSSKSLNKEIPEPRYLFMTKEELYKRYLSIPNKK